MTEAKKYYIITEGVEADKIYGSEYPVCVCEAEVRRLSAEWGVVLFEIMHEANESEIAEYGVYEG